MGKFYKIYEVRNDVAACDVQDIEPENGTDYTLEELQGYVEGYIEIVPLTDGDIMVVNEEGLLSDLLINPVATAIFQQATGEKDYIFGNVVICKDSEVL